MPASLVEIAPAKVNLTLRVVGRRDDGYHELESLVVFADFGDRLGLVPGGELSLRVRGPSAAQAGPGDDNLVLKAVRALTARRAGLRLGAFTLDKKLPVAAGVGGGSADAAAALRLIAQANDIPGDDRELYAAARATSADVPVCLDPRPRIMRGIGEILSVPLLLPRLPAVLVNPRVAVPTKAVFTAWKDAAVKSATPPLDPVGGLTNREPLLRFLETQANDLEAPAITLAPAIAEVLAALRSLSGCRLARMSGSGATCFALFAGRDAARAAGRALRDKYAHWWVRTGILGGNLSPH